MTTYLNSAVSHHDAGWLPFPLPVGRKIPPPVDRTGWKSLILTPLTREEVESEASAHSDRANIGVRVPVGVLGIDVDVYHGGDQTLTSLIAECGPLPVTSMSTARTDGSGIRMFQVPDDYISVSKLPGIELIQPHHRFAVVHPSIHPKIGTTYQWVGSEDAMPCGIPVVAQLPELPDTWLKRLESKSGGSHEKSSLSSADIVELAREWLTPGEMGEELTGVVERLRDITTGPAESRYERARNAQLTIIRMGEQGYPGVSMALDLVYDWYEDVIDGERSIESEWRRGLEGAIRLVANDPTPGPPDLSMFPDSTSDESETGPTGRTRVDVGNKSLASEWLDSEIGSDALSGFFHRDGDLVYTPRINEDGYVPAYNPAERNGPAQIRTADPLYIKTAVEVGYDVGKRVRAPAPAGGSRVFVWSQLMFPAEVAIHTHTAAINMLNTPNLRPITGVTHTPLIRPDGSVLDSPGYDTVTQMLYLPDPGLTVGTVSDAPSDTELKDAVELISSIVDEFPFVKDFHRANWFGALFTPIMRMILPPPYPQFVIDAPQAGSGKSYLARIISDVHGGVLRAGFPADDAEFSKGIMGLLLEETAPVVTWDNVRGKLSSQRYESLLTTRKITDRMLGANINKTATNDRLWLVTGNNCEIGGDLARRSLWISINAMKARPHERTGFKLDLGTWVEANRGRIIHALLTVVRAWVVAGSLTIPAGRSDDYATYRAGVAGMLRWAGFPGEFGYADAEHEETDESREWAVFLAEVHRVIGDERFKPGLITYMIADDMSKGSQSVFAGDTTITETGEKIDPSKLPGILADSWSKARGKAGFAKSLGLWLKHRGDQYAGDYVVRVYPDRKNGNSYAVECWNE